MRAPLNRCNAAVVTVFLLSVCGATTAQDVHVNFPDTKGEIQGNHTTESETSVARQGSLVVVGYNTSRQLGQAGTGAFTSFSGYAYSANGGASFTDAGFVEAGTTSLGHTVILAGDPALAFDSSGNLYYASLLEDHSTGDSYVAVSKSTSTSPTVTFGNAVVLSGPSSTTAMGFEDKEFIAVDNTGGPYNGRVYVAWTDIANQSAPFPSTNSLVFAASSSTTPTLTFGSTLSLATSSTSLLHGAYPVVGADGAVYVAWSNLTSLGFPAAATIQLVKSTDGGAHFFNPDPFDSNPSRLVASFTSLAASISTGTTVVGKSIVSPLRTRSFPMLAADYTPVGSPTHGNLYCVYAAWPSSAASPRAEVFFTASTDGGASWSVPRNITSGGAATLSADTTTNDNWFPFITVSPVTGHIKVLLYSRREDPGNQNIRVYEAGSTDGGMTFYNRPFSAVAFTPSVDYDTSVALSYMGDYLSGYADASGLLAAWGDTRDTCSPPTDATIPCSPAGRGDQDVWAHTESDATGVDLAITPWGAVTGVGPLYQSPDIFVVNPANVQVNPRLGVINTLDARIRNLGNTAASGATVRFRFAPAYAGVPDSAFKLIGTASVNAPAGGAPQTVSINWDLKNLNDTNGGIWPQPIAYYSHFCVRVDIEYPSDINMSNNAAQSNFVDVISAGPAVPLPPLHFMIGNPYQREAKLSLSVSKLPPELLRHMKEPVILLPSNLQSRERSRMVAVKSAQPAEFVFHPQEIQNATIELYRPPAAAVAHLKKDLIVDVSALVDGNPVSGISILLARAPRTATPVAPAHPIKVVSQEVSVPLPQGTTQAQVFEMRAALAPAGARAAIVTYLGEQKIAVEQNDPERNLVSSGAIALNHGQLLEAVSERVRAALPEEATGVYFLTFKLAAQGQQTSVAVSTRIMLNQSGILDSPLRGPLLPSSGQLERTALAALTARMQPIAR